MRWDWQEASKAGTDEKDSKQTRPQQESNEAPRQVMSRRVASMFASMIENTGKLE